MEPNSNLILPIKYGGVESSESFLADYTGGYNSVTDGICPT